MATKKKTTFDLGETTPGAGGAGYGPGYLVRGGHSGQGGKAPIIAGKVLKAAGITPTDPNAADNAEQSGYDAAMKEMAANAAKTGSSGGPSALDRYTQQLQAMLTGGAYRKPYEDLQSQLQGLYGQANTQIGSSMDALKSALQGQANPYAGFQAQNVQATPQLSELLASQGVSANPLQQLAAATQAQNAGQASAFNNLVSSLGTIYGANQAGQISDVAAQRADLQNQLAQSNLGYGAQLNEQATGQQQKLITMLLAALAKGGKPKKGRLF